MVLEERDKLTEDWKSMYGWIIKQTKAKLSRTGEKFGGGIATSGVLLLVVMGTQAANDSAGGLD